MLFNLLATILLGIATAGIFVTILRRVGLRTPTWLLPTSALVAILTFQIWSEYSWYGRTAKTLPAHVVVTGAFADSRALQPWTIIAPPVVRFSAVDRSSIARHDAAPTLAMAEVHLVQRYAPTVSAFHIYDCETPQRADATPGYLDGNGLPLSNAWTAIDPNDPIRLIVCQLETIA
jgi:hypothetical protein